MGKNQQGRTKAKVVSKVKVDGRKTRRRKLRKRTNFDKKRRAGSSLAKSRQKLQKLQSLQNQYILSEANAVLTKKIIKKGILRYTKVY